MRRLILENQFRRDVKLAQKRGKDTHKLRVLIQLLERGGALPAKYKDHSLSGNWQHYRECHIEPDWLLIDKASAESVFLVRTGTHSDLF